MSHTGVEVFDFLLYTVYPVIGIFVAEVISRALKIPKWIKLSSQAVISTGFGIAYLSLPGDEKFPLTALVLFALAIALFYQAKRSKNNPEKVQY